MERGLKLFDLVLACVLILRLLLVLLIILLAVGVGVVGVRLDVGRRRLASGEYVSTYASTSSSSDGSKK